MTSIIPIDFEDFFPEPTILEISIDRLTIMGNWIYKGEEGFQKLLDSQYEFFGKRKFGEDDGDFDELSIDFLKGEGSSEPIGKMFGKVFFQAFDQKRFKNRRQFRMEFNPNKLTMVEKNFLLTKIMPLLKNVSFTRIDVAFDFEEDVSRYEFFEPKNPRSRHYHESPQRKVETLYLGARESENMVRIYNKKKERLAALKRGDYLTSKELKWIQEKENWWRIEFQISRELANDFHNEKTIFRDLEIILPDWKTIKDTTDMLYIKGLKEKTIDWSCLPKGEKKRRLKRLFSSCSKVNLMDYMKDEYHKERIRLVEETDVFLEASQQMIFEKEDLEKKKATLSGKQDSHKKDI